MVTSRYARPLHLRTRIARWADGEYDLPRPPFVAAVLALVICIPYLNTLTNEYVWDDVYQLPAADAPLPSWDKLFLEPSWMALKGEDLHTVAQSPNAIKTYRPLMLLSFWIDANLMKGNPLPFHVTNLVLFYLLLVALMLIGFELTDRRSAVCVAIVLWGFNPVLHESISWISGRHDTLMTIFMALSILAVCKGVKADAWHRVALIAAGLLLFVFALGSKEPSIVLPIILGFLLCDFSHRISYSSKERIVILALYCAVAAGYLFVRSQIVASRNLAGGTVGALNVLGIAPTALARYLLSFFYLPHLTSHFLQPNANVVQGWQWGLTAALHAGILGTTFFLRGRSPWPWLGALVFYGFVAPGLVMVANKPEYSLRFMFTGALGVAVLCAAVLTMATNTVSQRIRVMIAAAVLLYSVTNGHRIFERNRDYANDEAFYKSIIRDVPDSPIGYTGLGDALLRASRSNEAIYAYSAAHKVDPTYLKAYNNLVVLLIGTGNLDRAEAITRQGLSYSPTYDKLLYNLGVIEFNRGHYESATRAFDRALQINPHYSRASEMRQRSEALSQTPPSTEDSSARGELK